MRNLRRGGIGGGAAALLIVLWGGACGAEPQPATVLPVPVETTTESSTVAPVRATAVVRVLILGTSITAGQGLDPDSAYPAVLQRLADSVGYRALVVAAGLSGETSAGALRRVDWLLRDRADLVVIETGANDGLRGLQVDTTRANLAGIIRKVRSANPTVRVVLAQMEAPTNLGRHYTRDFHDAFLAVARAEQVTLIPFFLEGIAGVPDLNQDDGIHPNEEGARRAARNMWKALAPLLRTLPGVTIR